MTARTDLAERIMQVLEGHHLHASMNICDGVGCDWRADSTVGRSLYAQHRTHLAAVLTDVVAGWLTDDTTVETAAEAMRHPWPADFTSRTLARAALSAVLREGDER